MVGGRNCRLIGWSQLVADEAPQLRISLCKVINAALFFFQAEDGIRDYKVTGVQTCALPISIVLIAGLTGAAAFLGDAVLVPISEVGAAVGAIGWCAACLAFIALSRRDGVREGVTIAAIGAVVSVAIVVVKGVPLVPGGFTTAEWLAFTPWCASRLAPRPPS